MPHVYNNTISAFYSTEMAAAHILHYYKYVGVFSDFLCTSTVCKVVHLKEKEPNNLFFFLLFCLGVKRGIDY